MCGVRYFMKAKNLVKLRNVLLRYVIMCRQDGQINKDGQTDGSR